MRTFAVVFASVSALLLSAPGASAEEKRDKKIREITTKAPTHLRSSKATLASARSRSLDGPSVVRAKQAKGEETIVGPRVSAGDRRKPAKPLNPYQSAFQALKDKANAVNPAIGGRINVSFTIGRDGKPGKIMLYGFDAGLDKALTQVLAQQQFPKKDAGQFYSSKLSVVATKKPAPVKKRKRRRK